MVIKSLIRYKKRVRYQLTAHPLFISYGFFVSLFTYMIQRWKPFCSRALLISLTWAESRVSMVTRSTQAFTLLRLEERS